MAQLAAERMFRLEDRVGHERRGVLVLEPVVDPRSVLARRDHAREAHLGEVLGHGRWRLVDDLGKVVDGKLRVAKGEDDPHASGVGEHGEDFNGQLDVLGVGLIRRTTHICIHAQILTYARSRVQGEPGLGVRRRRRGAARYARDVGTGRPCWVGRRGVTREGTGAIETSDVEYRLQRAWTVTQSGGSLTVHGGADARYLIDLGDSEPSRFASLGYEATVRRRDLGLDDQRVLEQLVTAQIVVPVLKRTSVLRVALLGDTVGIEIPPHGAVRVVAASTSHDLGVVVRATSTYSQLLVMLDYANLTIPHLFVDLAFHHTVSIGPLVFPGETACIACLEGRVRTRWGDDAPPPSPRVAEEEVGFVGELVASELTRIAGGDTTLTNATVSWDLHARTAAKDQLLKVPLCPVCNRTRMDRDGSLALPWRTA